MQSRGDPMVGGLGLYLHIPFCQYKCPYCDFNSGPYQETVRRGYLDALKTEIQESSWVGYPVRAVSFGGGTPSELTILEISVLIETIRKNFSVMDSCEWTLECNPDSVLLFSLVQLNDLGINRLSLGAQSFHDHYLKFLGRSHKAKDTQRTFDWARAAGFDNINLDLLFGMPEQSIQDWCWDLNHALALGPEHLSLNNLTVEKGTEFGRLRDLGQLPDPNEDTVAIMYESSLDLTAVQGVFHYELSSFSRPGLEWKLGEIYWKCQAYLGMGVSAASFVNGTRWTNTPSPGSYITGVSLGRVPRAEEEHLSGIRAISEEIVLGLRHRDGVSLPELSSRYGCSVESIYDEPLTLLSGSGLISFHKDRVTLTRRGLLFSDTVSSKFLHFAEGRVGV